MDKRLFELRLTHKQLLGQHKRCLKEEKREISKLKRTLGLNDPESVKIYAQNAVRKKNEGLACLRLASRVDAVAAKVQTAMTMQQLTKTIDGVVTRMERAMEQLDLEAMAGIMDDFERVFEDLDVATDTLETSVAATSATLTPAEDVDELIERTAIEAGLDLQFGASRVPSATSLQQQSQLDGMLARLREMDS